jgi:CHAT domain-containing protein
MTIPGAVLRRGSDVTAAAFDRLDYSVIHIATHADVNEEHPFLSRLRLADGPLNAYQLYGAPLPQTALVVLSGCSTAAGPNRRGEGVLSLARPFLARGVPTVVATLWDVPDAPAAELFADFHRARLAGRPDGAALRQAQVSLMTSADPSLRNPRVWAAAAVNSRAAAAQN